MTFGYPTPFPPLRIEATSPNPKKLVHAYVASQAAVPAEAYDPSMSTRPANDPDMFAVFNSSGPPTAYFAAIGSAADRVVNFFNPVDYATSNRWVTNQTFKPDLGYDTSTLRNFVRLGAGSDPNYTLNLSFPPDRYEAFAFAARAYSSALGAQAGVGGPLLTSAQVDLIHLSSLIASPPPGVDFTGHEWDHSAEFNGTNMDRKYYWNLLMKAFGLTPWDPTQTTYPVLP